jgi:mannose-1-phosphate guanylyltransferase
VSAHASPGQTVFLLNAAHRPYYQESLADVPERLLIEQPQNRGTATAIAAAVTAISKYDPDGVIAVFPSDHHYRHQHVVEAATETAYEAARRFRGRVFLVGAEAETPEPGYGWILAGPPMCHLGAQPVSAILEFREKPNFRDATSLLRRGAFWNTFIMAGTVSAFARMIEAARADLSPDLQTVDFSSMVLAPRPDELGVVPMHGAGWTDLGDETRLRRIWAETLRPAAVPARPIEQDSPSHPHVA